MPQIQRAPFGNLDGTDVTITRLENSSRMVVEVLDYGAIVRSVLLPGTEGPIDVALGLDDLDAYRACDSFLGATVGRVANRIDSGRFELDGHDYQLAQNDPPHHLHGGIRGFDKVVWTSHAKASKTEACVHLSYVSPDGEEGYPGTARVHVSYALTESCELRIEMTATCDRPTPLALAHHSYWNLGGHAAGTLEDHELVLSCDEMTPGNPVVPQGSTLSVAETPFDFRRPRRLTGLCDLQLNPDPAAPPGYDHNFVVRGEPTALRDVARLRHVSGREMTLTANQPGVQLYTGNFLDGRLAGKGARYGRHSALCLETQAFPNAVNVPAWRNQVILRPGQTYWHVMNHRFSVHSPPGKHQQELT